MVSTFKFCLPSHSRKEILHVEGFEQGIERGVEKKAKETARQLKRLGVENSVIQKATGLSKKEHERL